MKPASYENMGNQYLLPFVDIRSIQDKFSEFLKHAGSLIRLLNLYN